MDGYTIGELARLTDYPKDTIRYYERTGLISAPPRTAAGYRRYPQATAERLQMVRRAKELGFSLAEISELLDLLAHRDAPCQHLHCRLIDKLKELDSKISELHRLKDALHTLSQSCDPSTPIRHCPVLAVIAPDEKIASLLVKPDDKD
jgi:MerR family transcriptional regulator, copper efflux regulator